MEDPKPPPELGAHHGPPCASPPPAPPPSQDEATASPPAPTTALPEEAHPREAPPTDRTLRPETPKPPQPAQAQAGPAAATRPRFEEDTPVIGRQRRGPPTKAAQGRREVAQSTVTNATARPAEGGARVTTNAWTKTSEALTLQEKLDQQAPVT